jgi:O-antigen biosynthesis protein
MDASDARQPGRGRMASAEQLSRLNGPLVSVIIATGQRRASLGLALRSVLENRHPSFDVWIVDTAPESPAPEAPSPLLEDPRVHLLRLASCGSAAAHNRAIALSRAEILAITDDDCEVASGWIEEMARAFDRDPGIGVVFGNVYAARPGDPSVPAYLRNDDFLARDLGEKRHVEGIWACMGIRRRTWAALGGFDERFGHGAAFPGAADADFAVRALAAGHLVYETPRVFVRSHRSLTPDEHRRAVTGYTYASGALIGKHLRRRTPGVLGLAAGIGRRWLGGRTHTALGASRGRRGARRLIAFLHGVARGAGSASD